MSAESHPVRANGPSSVRNHHQHAAHISRREQAPRRYRLRRGLVAHPRVTQIGHRSIVQRRLRKKAPDRNPIGCLHAVDPRRFELLTSSMRTRRATNCAKGPFCCLATLAEGDGSGETGGFAGGANERVPTASAQVRASQRDDGGGPRRGWVRRHPCCRRCPWWHNGSAALRVSPAARSG
jgi:hypothetical protein